MLLMSVEWPSWLFSNAKIEWKTAKNSELDYTEGEKVGFFNMWVAVRNFHPDNVSQDILN